MTQIIVQLEGAGAFRMDAKHAAHVLQTELDMQNSHDPLARDVYVANAVGVWAPCFGFWCLWEPAF